MWSWFIFASLSLLAGAAHGQEATINIEVRHDAQPVSSASVIVNGSTHTTNAEGKVSVNVPPGTAEIVVAKEGFSPATATVSIDAGQRRDVIVELQPLLQEVITVSATRTDRRLEDQPIRVEVLSREEIEEKLMMTPGDIVMMLNEMGGM